MIFLELFRYELSYQFKRPATWIYSFIFLVIAGCLVLSFTDNVQAGDYLMNAPVVITFMTAAASLICALVVAATASDSATRDTHFKIDSLFYTLPVTKFTYLAARFSGAFVLSAFILAVFQIGLYLIAVLPVLDKALFGPVAAGIYLKTYCMVGLPNLFFVSSVLFSVALFSRQSLLSFLSGSFLFIASFGIKEILAEQFGYWKLAKLLDYAGLTILYAFKKTITPATINLQPINLEGDLLLNRLLWFFISIVILSLTFFRFRFKHQEITANWWNRLFTTSTKTTSENSVQGIAAPQITGNFGFRTNAYQFITICIDSYKFVLKNWSWFFILSTAIFTFLYGAEMLDGPLGVPLLPTTGKLASKLGDLLYELIIISLIIVNTGQLIWKERDAGMHTISDAAPVPDWVMILGKFSGIILLILTFQAALMITGIGIQFGLNYTNFQPLLYVRILFGLQLVDYVLFTLFTWIIHVLVNQKYLGHVLSFLFFLAILFANSLQIEHHMLLYRSGSSWFYSTISGFGNSLHGWVWFKAYWLSIAFGLAIAVRLVWVRDLENSLTSRLKKIPERFNKFHLILTGLALLLIMGFGFFVFYNTNILNRYFSLSDTENRRVVYEKRYRKYLHLQQPVIKATNLYVSIFPDKQKAILSGSYILKNESDVPVTSIHLATATDVQTRHISFNKQVVQKFNDSDLGYNIYKLKSPLQPHDSIKMNFKLRYELKGFTNNGTDNTLVKNGSFIVNQDWLPVIGYQPSKELQNESKRKKYKLPTRKNLFSYHNQTAIKNKSGREHIRFQALISTPVGQQVVAPGRLLKSWKKNGKHYFKFASESPILNLYPIASAAYRVKKSKWKNIEVHQYYHPSDTLNLKQMEKSVKSSLEYYTRNFGPYPHSVLKLVSYPGAAISATSFPGTIAYTENFGAIHTAQELRNFDLPFAVIAHETAHQWWGNQLVPAKVEGAALLTESLAWYSALGVIEKAQGTDALNNLLAAMRAVYLSPRNKAGLPLLRASDMFLAYRKGPFAMFALREYLGEHKVNLALRNLLQKHPYTRKNLAVSTDLLQELQAVTPDTLQYLLHDLFQKNTYWEFTARHAQTTPLRSGKWQIKFEFNAQKKEVDSIGNETAVQMHDFVEIGIYAASNIKEHGRKLYLKKHRVRSGKNIITLVVSAKPAVAGIDPRHLLIDTVTEDNFSKTVVVHVNPSQKSGNSSHFVLFQNSLH